MKELEVKTEKSSATSKETLIVQNSKLYLKTSSGEEQINILPEDASSKATTRKINKIEIKGKMERNDP